jgi:hypothetical protein
MVTSIKYFVILKSELTIWATLKIHENANINNKSIGGPSSMQ